MRSTSARPAGPTIDGRSLPQTPRSRTQDAVGHLPPEGLAKDTPERQRIAELDRLITEHKAKKPE